VVMVVSFIGFVLMMVMMLLGCTCLLWMLISKFVGRMLDSMIVVLLLILSGSLCSEFHD